LPNLPCRPSGRPTAPPRQAAREHPGNSPSPTGPPMPSHAYRISSPTPSALDSSIASLRGTLPGYLDVRQLRRKQRTHPVVVARRQSCRRVEVEGTWRGASSARWPVSRPCRPAMDRLPARSEARSRSAQASSSDFSASAANAGGSTMRTLRRSTSSTCIACMRENSRLTVSMARPR